MALISLNAPALGAEPPAFSYTLFQEPTTLDPQMLSGASGNYITTLIYRGLYRWNDRLVPDEGECHWETPLRLKCRVFSEVRWSDGSSVTAHDYARAFRFLVDPKNAAPNAESVSSVSRLDVIDDLNFMFHFSEPDSEFLYKLLHPSLYPRHSSFKPRFKPSAQPPVVNGPFRIVKWKSGSWFELERNPRFFKKLEKNSVRKLKALIVDSDVTALQLFETQKIHFLRRLPAQEYVRFQKRPEYFRWPILRFDYVGFSHALFPHQDLRRALSESFDPKSFQELFDSKPPGCPSIPPSFYSGDMCIKSPVKTKKTKWPEGVAQVFAFSQQGGEDIQRIAEWFQRQWASRLGIQVNLESREQKTYLAWLKSDPPAIFRKGVSLDRPTCLAALEIFGEKNPENFIRFKNAEFEKVLKKLAQTTKDEERKSLCTKGLRILKDSWTIIPSGEIVFTGLMDSRFTGWRINNLNQLDLRDLVYTEPRL